MRIKNLLKRDQRTRIKLLSTNLNQLIFQLSELKKSLSINLSFFTEDFNAFLKIRKRINLEKTVGQTVIVDTRTGEEKIEIDIEDQNFKNQYT